MTTQKTILTMNPRDFGNTENLFAQVLSFVTVSDAVLAISLVDIFPTEEKRNVIMSARKIK